MSKKLKEEIENPDFEFIKQHLGVEVPLILQDLYKSGKVFELEEIIVDEDELYFCVTSFAPLNKSRYSPAWPGTENYLNFANDGAGNLLIAKPEENFKKVYFFDHETGELEDLGIDIPTVIRKLEEWKGRDD